MKIAMTRFTAKVLLPIAIVFGLMACATTHDLVTISGDIMYRERIALPDDAVLTVQIKDVSLQDTKAIVIAERVLDNVVTPQAFEFQIAADQFQQGHSYAVGARIEVNGKLWFINTQTYRVDVNETQQLNIIVNKVGG
ncbi:YbaY family lipoprotein [Shewanella donghaensis]|uniref:YbaY family lipoprotein n=1 Tax=Shewanella donghaensis TaxID=238836 RepID=UPI0011835C01|nr:YbaY family lipoprotein [Shewanella donghaensis]